MSLPPLQPLRIPAGWCVTWNTLFDLDPSPENVAGGFFGGSSLLLASSEHRRSCVCVEWRPEDDPAGCYRLRVLYARWPRTPDGRRRTGLELDFDWQSPVHESETRDRAELVRELERWLEAAPGSAREHN